MKCPYCDKEIDDIGAYEDDLDYREFWYNDHVKTIRGFQCPHCNSNFVLKEDYRLVSSRVLKTKGV